jgi:hypothetical protein
MTEAQQRAERKRQEKRKGQPTFAAIRFSNSADATTKDKKSFVESVIARHGGTREAALLAAFRALENNLK